MTPENLHKVRTAKALMRGHFNRPTYDPWDMMGPSNTRARQAVMHALTGKRLPTAKCGVNALCKEFAALLGCAERSRAIEDALREID